MRVVMSQIKSKVFNFKVQISAEVIFFFPSQVANMKTLTRAESNLSHNESIPLLL